MNVYELALRYYPALWNKDRIEMLVAVGRLSREDADEIYRTKENQ